MHKHNAHTLTTNQYHIVHSSPAVPSFAAFTDVRVRAKEMDISDIAWAHVKFGSRSLLAAEQNQQTILFYYDYTRAPDLQKNKCTIIN